MARGVSMSIQGKGFDAMAKRLTTTALNTRKELGGTTERVTRLVEKDLKNRAFSGQKGSDPFWGVTAPPASSGTVGVRSGHTRRSITGRVFQVANQFVGIVGTGLKHVRLLEEGGTVTGNFRIPTRAAQTASGVDRQMGPRLGAGGQGWFLWPTQHQREGALARIRGTWLAKSVGGRLTLFYLLKQTLHYKARHMLRRTAERMKPEIIRQFGGMVRGLVVRVNR